MLFLHSRCLLETFWWTTSSWLWVGWVPLVRTSHRKLYGLMSMTRGHSCWICWLLQVCSLSLFCIYIMPVVYQELCNKLSIQSSVAVSTNNLVCNRLPQCCLIGGRVNALNPCTLSFLGVWFNISLLDICACDSNRWSLFFGGGLGNTQKHYEILRQAIAHPLLPNNISCTTKGEKDIPCSRKLPNPPLIKIDLPLTCYGPIYHQMEGDRDVEMNSKCWLWTGWIFVFCIEYQCKLIVVNFDFMYSWRSQISDTSLCGNQERSWFIGGLLVPWRLWGNLNSWWSLPAWERSSPAVVQVWPHTNSGGHSCK